VGKDALLVESIRNAFDYALDLGLTEEQMLELVMPELERFRQRRLKAHGARRKR
jgi:hypothetical protein